MPGLRVLRIRTRLTLWYAGIFSVIFGGLGLFLVVNLRSTLERNAEESLELSYRGILGRVTEGQALGDVLLDTEIRGEVGQPEIVGQVLSADGAVIESSGEPSVARPVVGRDVLRQAAASGHWHHPVRLAGRDVDDVVIVARLDSGTRDGGFLVLAQTLAPVRDAVSRLISLLALAAPAALAVASFGGWAVARSALRRVDELTSRADTIDASKPHEPLPVSAPDDELARLARTLNGMLDRLERALAAERRFTADASHELRTPLAVIEAEIDVALRSERTPPEAKDVLRSVQAETGTLARIVANLLLLARAEAAGKVALECDDVDVLDLAGSVARRFRPIAADRDVTLRVTGVPVVATVDGSLLGQAVANLVDNAITHTDAGGRVTVEVEADGPAAVIRVEDTGTGIPADELGRIFDRFYRVDRSRDRRRGGSGLGLEITRRIVSAHDGSIAVVSDLGHGTTFTITIPTSRALDPERAEGAGGAAAPPAPSREDRLVRPA